MKHKKLLAPILIAVLLLASFGVATAQIGRGWFQVDSLKADGDLLIEGNSTLLGELSVGDTATLAGDVGVGAILSLTPATAISATNGSVITPTATYQPIDAAPSSTVTPTVAAGAAGQLLRLVNQGTATIILVDTGTAKLANTYSMGQYDSLLLMSDGTNWIEMGRSNN